MPAAMIIPRVGERGDEVGFNRWATGVPTSIEKSSLVAVFGVAVVSVGILSRVALAFEAFFSGKNS